MTGLIDEGAKVYQIRQPAVAGTFYPADKQTLASDIKTLLDVSRPGRHEVRPKAIIVPHAGYIYSGLTAAVAFTALDTEHDSIERVILLGPVHHVPVPGLALPDADVFATPLAEIQIDQAAVGTIKNLPQLTINADAHAAEHSLEVQLPFLQSVLDDFKLVPLVVGDATAEEVAEVLEVLWGGSETLIVVSSDLSHFLPYTTAQLVDAQSVQKIMQLQATLSHEQACGGTPINGLLLAAKHHNLKVQLLDLRNSGDTAGDKSHVVGYASFAFTGAGSDAE